MNTNSARKTRAVFALGLLFVSGAISLFILTDAIKYGETIEFYLGGVALWEAVWAFAGAVVLFAWNAVTYSRPRYARRSR